MVALFGETGNIAMDVYNVIRNPENAPLAIFGIIAGAGALADVGKVGKAAAIRRVLSAQDTTRLGSGIKPKLDKIATVINACKR